MKIGILGGTFDPFTLAHREIVKEVLDLELVDKIIIAPSIVDWHREGKAPWLSDLQKIDVIKEFIDTLPKKDKISLYLDDLKLKACVNQSPELFDSVVKSRGFIDTLIAIRAKVGLEEQLYPIMGVDSWKMFKLWKNWRAVVDQSTGIIVVGGRDGEPFESCADIPKAFPITIDPKFANTSATKIREGFKSVENYVAWAKEEIANQHNGDKLLVHTPIFDVMKGAKTETGLRPVKIKAPDWVSIIVKRGREFLIEKQFRYGSNCDIEEFPCGMVEEGESPHKAVIRELEEETGIRISLKDIKYLGATNPNPAFMTNKMHYFYVDLDKSGYEQHSTKLDQHENIELHWEDMDEFCKRILNLAKHSSPKVPAILLSAFALFTANAIAIDG